MDIAKNPKNKILYTQEGAKIVYQQTIVPDSKVGVVFLGGFMSDMQGTKASYLEKVCQNLHISYVRFDYFGHGASEGKLEEGTIGRWKKDALGVLDELTQGPQILVGSSMGGWLMLLVALERRERINALVGIAAAPDFIDDFSRLNAEQQKTLEKDGICYLPSHYGAPYPITRHLLEDGFKHCILKGPIDINCPVRLLHGMVDEQVPWQQSLKLAERLTSQEVHITLIKDGDHRLSEENQLKTLEQILSSLVVA
jgi:pimeloyl-ACP methyl ester carboxylesterase